MSNFSLRKIWLVARREYVERALTRSFLLATFATPLLLALLALLPSLLTSRFAIGLAVDTTQPVNVVLASNNHALADTIRRRLVFLSNNTYTVSIDPSVSAAEHAALLERVTAGKINGFVWLDAGTVADRKVSFTTRNVTDVVLQTRLEGALSYGFRVEALRGKGVPEAEVAPLLAGVNLEIVKAGQTSTFDVLRGAIVVLALVAVIFFSLLSYGVMVMRSVLEEKASRITEILLCSTTSQELMSGKVIGVGAVGVTQIAVWLGMAAIAASRSAYFHATIYVLNLGPAIFVYFVIFYLLGYLLYSAIFAAVGAAFNSVDEAQQWNFVIIMPLIVASALILPIVNSPDSILAVVSSIFPFCAPVLMFERVAIHSPPLWQVIAALAATIAAIFAMFAIAARIYRVGILMYGKRPSPRELWRWLKHA
ncbi:MAG: ABC transporter permease [Candidatus Binataceae bacterium]